MGSSNPNVGWETTALGAPTGEPDPRATRDELYLLVFEQASASMVTLPRNGEVVIGRGDSCDVVVKDKLVSRRHAKIVIADGIARLHDLDSSNGTRVNSEAT